MFFLSLVFSIYGRFHFVTFEMIINATQKDCSERRMFQVGKKSLWTDVHTVSLLIILLQLGEEGKGRVEDRSTSSTRPLL